MYRTRPDKVIKLRNALTTGTRQASFLLNKLTSCMTTTGNSSHLRSNFSELWMTVDFHPAVLSAIFANTLKFTSLTSL
jgi:hypothetical protein